MLVSYHRNNFITLAEDIQTLCWSNFYRATVYTKGSILKHIFLFYSFLFQTCKWSLLSSISKISGHNANNDPQSNIPKWWCVKAISKGNQMVKEIRLTKNLTKYYQHYGKICFALLILTLWGICLIQYC